MEIPTGFSQVNVRFEGNGYTRGAEVVFGVDNDAALSPAALAAFVSTEWQLSLLGLQGTAITLREIKVKNGPTDTGPEATISVGEPGTDAGNTLPPNSAVLVKKLTALGGRMHTGRMFFPGATETQTDGAGKLTTSALSDYQDGFDAFFTAMSGGDLPVALLHTDATTPDLLTSFQVMQLMASQRRRLRRVGGRPATP